MMASGYVRESSKFGGGSVEVMAHIGGAQYKIKMDVTFDDRHDYAETVEASVPSILNLPPLKVRRPAWNHVVADKVQALVRHGPANHRLCDLYDLYVFLGRPDVDPERCAPAMLKSFEAFDLPIPYGTDAIAALAHDHAIRRELYWEKEKTAKKFKTETPPFPELCAILRDRLQPFVAAAAALQGPALAP